MTQQIINLGTADKGNGDVLRTAFGKVNANFAELYTLTGDDIQIPAQATHTGKVLTTNGTTLSWGTVSYTSLTDKPTIPTSFSSLVNDTKTVSLGTDGYITLAHGTKLYDYGSGTGNGYGITDAANGTYIGYDPTDAGGALHLDTYNGKNIRIRTTTLPSTYKDWLFGSDGSLTFPNATVQSTAYVAPTTGNSTIVSDPEGTTVSRNGMTIRVTSAGTIQMSFDSAINVKGRSSINNTDSTVIASPNGVTTIGTWYNIGAVLAEGDHLTATIVNESYHQIYRLTAIIIQKTTTPGQEIVVSYAIIEQLQ